MLEVKNDIIEALNLEDMTPVDALELIVLLEKKYGIKLQDPKDGRKVFKSVRVMAEFIQANRTK